MQINFNIYQDWVRISACFMVLVYHYFPSALPFGYLGVDLFFILSGYFISGIALQATGKRYFALVGRRLLRLIQPLPFVLLFTLIASVLILDGYKVYYGFRTILAFLFGGSNIELFLQGGYFSDNSLNKLFLHFWSLGVEVQFYLFFLLLVVLLAKKAHFRTILLVLCCISMVAFAASYNLSERLGFFGPVGRFFEFATGALLYGLVNDNGEARFWGDFHIGVMLVGLALLTSFCYLYMPGPQNLFLVPLVCLAYLLLTSLVLRFRSERASNKGTFRFIARSTYSIYLVHWPVLVLLPGTMVERVVGFILSISLGFGLEVLAKSNNFGLMRNWIVCFAIAILGFAFGAQTKEFDPILESKLLPKSAQKYQENYAQSDILVVGDSFGEDLMMLADGLLTNSHKSQIHFVKVLSNCGVFGIENVSYPNGAFDTARCQKDLESINRLDLEKFSNVIVALDWKEQTVRSFTEFLNTQPFSPVWTNLMILTDKAFCDPRRWNCSMSNVWKSEDFQENNMRLTDLSEKFGFDLIDWQDYLPESFDQCIFSFDGSHLSMCARHTGHAEKLIDLVFQKN